MGTATLQPRADIGTYGEKQQTTPVITLAAADITERRLAAAQYVLDEFGNIEVSHHGAGRRDYVLLEEMGEPDLARGNCWIITNEIIEQVDPGEFGAHTLTELTIDGHGHHVALLVTDAHGEYILDYTARQFSPDLPYPFVASYVDWLAAINTATARVWTLHDFEDDECEHCGEALAEDGICDGCAVD